MTVTTLDSRQPAQPSAALAIRPGQTDWDKFQAAALAQIGLKDASSADRAVFLHQCQRTGLDPFSRQIYMIGRNEKVPGTKDQWRTKWTIQTGIDGWRVIRDRAERRAGVRGTLGRAIWYDHEGNEFKVWVRPDPPAACEITYTVRDSGGETPYTSVLQFAEYVQVKDGRAIAQWATKGSHMLEKCTEADVYRKAFPQDFAGVSLDDAMPPPDGDAPPPTAARVTAADIRGRTRPQVRAEIVRDPIDASPAENEATPPPPAGEAPDPTHGAGGAASPPDTGSSTAPNADGRSEPDGAYSGRERKLTGVIQAHFKRLGFTDDEREQRLAATAALAGVHEITSTGDLVEDELSTVADALAHCKNRDALIALMVDGEKPEASDA